VATVSTARCSSKRDGEREKGLFLVRITNVGVN
jgi:hypothetical protein